VLNDQFDQFDPMAQDDQEVFNDQRVTNETPEQCDRKVQDDQRVTKVIRVTNDYHDWIEKLLTMSDHGIARHHIQLYR
jgi:hypothetical protein